jgi:hypothetical protein
MFNKNLYELMSEQTPYEKYYKKGDTVRFNITYNFGVEGERNDVVFINEKGFVVHDHVAETDFDNESGILSDYTLYTRCRTSFSIKGEKYWKKDLDSCRVLLTEKEFFKSLNKKILDTINEELDW